MKQLYPALIAFLLLMVPSVGLAGYLAELRTIGFSKDGKIFAYEEFFVEPENGNAFSSIFFLYTEKNAPLAGTPVEGSSGKIDDISGARAKAYTKAKHLIETYKLQSDPGNIVAFAPSTEIDATNNSLRYYANPSLPPVGDSYTLTLEQVSLPVTETCRDQGLADIGFRLTLGEIHGAPSQLKVYEDTTLPKERNCPEGYRLGGMITSNFHQTLQIALIEVITRGFDGQNAHWLAIPFRVPAIP